MSHIKTPHLDNYNPHQRKIDTVAIIIYLGLLTYLLYLLIPFGITHPLLTFFSLILGMIGADIGTGLLHWAGDTWGTPTWKIIGPAFIRPFRQHHVDQKAITRHDFIETNGSNSLFSLPFLIIAFIIFHIVTSTFSMFLVATFIFTALFGFLTNQFHKWAHMDNPPSIAKILHKTGLILRPDHHHIHHTRPFEHHYAITNGWTNALTRKIKFYRALEFIIKKTTGAKPRESDLEVVAEQP